MTQAAARLRRELALLGVEHVGAAVLDRDAGGREALGRVRLERGLEKGRYFCRRKAITSVMFLPVRG